MAWQKLNTTDIYAVKYHAPKAILKARLKSGHVETYQQVSEARYRELLAGAHPHDIDTFFSNIIRPNCVSRRVTLTESARLVLRFSLITILVVAVLALLGLWNSGILDSYLAGMLPASHDPLKA